MKTNTKNNQNFTYEPEEHKAYMIIDGHPVTLTFETDKPENCIWHYIFTAMAQPSAETAHKKQHC